MATETKVQNINDFASIHWQSDWNGDEVGHNEIDVVGLYNLTDMTGVTILAYINAETGDILEILEEDED